MNLNTNANKMKDDIYLKTKKNNNKKARLIDDLPTRIKLYDVINF